MKITSEARQKIISDACRIHKDLPSLTLAKMLYKDNPALFLDLEAARHAVRYKRGNDGKNSRGFCKDKSLFRENQKAGFSYSFPKSSAPDYQPFILDSKNTLILSDLHIPFHDTPAIMAAVEFAKRRKTDCILLNGDVCDFFSASSFDKNPTETQLKEEINLTRNFLGWLREQFPKAKIIYKLGNHDERFEKYIFKKAPEFYGVSGITLSNLITGAIVEDGIPEVKQIEFVDDQRKIKAGKLNIWHGHEIGKGFIAPVNPARGLFMRTLDSGLMGHLHRGSVHEETTSNGKLITTWSSGCLCGLWPRYARVNKWNHGAMWLELDGNNFSVQSIRILNGKVL